MPDPSALLRSMASAFEGVVKSVVRELDRSGELIPMNSLRNSTSFQPYCLLGRKSSSSWFWRPRYVCVNLSIRDILEPNIPEPGTPPGTELESQLGGEREGQTATCTGPLGCLFSEGRAFSKVPSLGGTGAASRMGPHLWPCSSCRVCRPLPLPRRRGREAAGQRGAGDPGTGDICRWGCSVRKLQCLNERVHAASEPQHLGGHAPREVGPQGQGPADPR